MLDESCFCIIQNPFPIFFCSCVNSRIVRISTAEAEANDSAQLTIAGQGTSTVTLATVDTSLKRKIRHQADSENYS
jgi:hypothetical protein